jgi:hypothetical protein
MEGNIVGEPLDDFVAKQVGIRQSNQFGGYNTSRTNSQLQYLNNRNAWVKLASSVEIEEGLIPLPPPPPAPSPSPGNPFPGFPQPWTPGGGAVLTPTPAPIPQPGPIPGLTNVRLATSTKLRKLGIVNPTSYGSSKLAEAAVLFNTLSEYTGPNSPLNFSRAGISKTNTKTLFGNPSAYGIGGTEFGIQPPPGIVSVQVDSLNRGSIRKANVVLKAHNKFQFDLIEILYLRLGFTMMLEWGWDKYLNDKGEITKVENTIIEETWFTSKGTTQLEMLKKIQEMRKKYQGNVDGFFGKVSNFTWSFGSDGTYDITIDLITVGDVIESIKVNVPIKTISPSIASVTNSGDSDALEKLFGNIPEAAALSSLGAYLLETILWMIDNKVAGLLDGPQSLGYAIIEPKIVNTKDERTWTLVPNFPPSRRFYYVRLGTLLKILENYIMPQIQNGNITSLAPQLYISSDEATNKISIFPNQISLDPRVCIFGYADCLNSYGDITGVTPPIFNKNLTLNPYIQVNNQTGKFAALMNLYMNIEFISGLLLSNGGPDQELSLFKFLQDLCNGINDALGGVNKLEPVIKDDSTIVIIDQTYSQPVKDIVDLEIYGYNTVKQTSNFVKDVKFVSKITPQLASMISIGATAAGTSTSEIDGTAFSKFSDGLVDRFAQTIQTPIFPQIVKGTPVPAVKTTGTFKPEELKNLTDKNYGFYLVNAFGGTSNTVSITGANSVTYPAFVDPAKARYFEFNDTFITEGKSAYKIYMNELNNNRLISTSLPSSEVGFIPLSFELVLDGISGIKIYNKLSINAEFLPSNYPDSLRFIITKVNHNISNNSWDTSLSTVSMPETKPYEYGKFPASQGGSGGGTGNTGNTGGGNTGGTGNVSNNITGLLTPQPGQSGLLEPLKSIAAKYESGAKGYGAANTGTTKGCVFFSTTNVENIEFGELRRLMRLPGGTGCNRARVFAAGKYQIIPITMFGSNKDANKNYTYDAGLWKQLGLTDTDKYTPEIQEKMFLQMILNRTSLGNYLTAKNQGTLPQLSSAIQDLSQLFSSMPTIKRADGNIVGNVELGTGNTGYYLDSVNSKPKAISVRQIAKIIVQTRINYSGAIPKEYPSYYTSPV